MGEPSSKVPDLAMALRTTQLEDAKNADGVLQTPAKYSNSSFDESNILDSMKKRFTSTALRPSRVSALAAAHVRGHRIETICLDNTIMSATESPIMPPSVDTNIKVNFELPSNDEQVPPRPSSVWLEDVISDAESLAEILRVENEQMKSQSESMESDELSSLGILSPSAMMDSFERTSGLNDSYQALMKYRNKDPLVAVAGVELPSENRVLEENYLNDESTLIASNQTTSEDRSYQNCNFSGLNVGLQDFSMRNSPYGFGFDSKEFINAESSVVQQQLEAANFPQRMDFNEFSGLIGEIDISPSWMSPEKRKQMPSRLTIGHYFSMQSSDLKELYSSLRPRRDSLESLKATSTLSPIKVINNGNFSGKSLSHTIDLTEDTGNGTEDTGNGTATIHDDTFDASPGGSTADNTLGILDMTLVPGRDSVMSLSTIARILNNTKGSDTVAGQLFEIAQRPGPSRLVKPSFSIENTPPSHSTSRETFVVSPCNSNNRGPEKTATKKANLTGLASTASPSRIPVPYRQHLPSSPLRVTKNSPSPSSSKGSPLVKKTSNFVKTGKNVTPVSNRKLHSKKISAPSVDLPLSIKGELQGTVGLPLVLSVLVTNISSEDLACTLFNASQSKHLEIKTPETAIISPKCSVSLNFEATALLSGEHSIQLKLGVQNARTDVIQYFPVNTAKLAIEVPKVTLENNQDTDDIDFGLTPEESRKMLVCSVKNLGLNSITIKIFIEQNKEFPSFFLLIPGDSEEELELADSMTFLLPGSAQTLEPPMQNIGLVFAPPSFDFLPNEKDVDILSLRGQLKISLHIPDSFEDKILYNCGVSGNFGRSSLLVSHTDVDLHSGTPQTLMVRNNGVVPLDLEFQAKNIVDSKKLPEPGVTVVPKRTLLQPNEETTLTLTWVPKPDQNTSTNRELHLIYEGLTVENIVNLKCHPGDLPSKELNKSITIPLLPLPIRSTRMQLAWGSVSSGVTAKQHVTLKNMSNKPLLLEIEIRFNDFMQETTFKLLSETDEVTHQTKLYLKPGNECKIQVMFCPLRPGPASAILTIASENFLDKKIELTGYGGNSSVKLRGLATAEGRQWLTLSPGLANFVDGHFSLANSGTLPACVLITSTPEPGVPCCASVRPNTLIIPAHSSKSVSVRLSEVSNTLSKAHPGEVKTLATLKIVWINEISRSRLRRLLPSLNTSDRVALLRQENVTSLQQLVDVHVEGQENLSPSLGLASLKDVSGPSFMSIGNDMEKVDVDLRAIGTGPSSNGPLEEDTASPFVSVMDATMVPFSGNGPRQSATEIETSWTISTQLLYLQPSNKFRAVAQVYNMSSENHLCLDIVAHEDLIVSPIVTEVQPCSTVALTIQLKKQPTRAALWPSAIKVYTANDVKTISVKVIPLNAGKSSRFGNTSQGLRMLPVVSTREWCTPNKAGSPHQIATPTFSRPEQNNPTPNTNTLLKNSLSISNFSSTNKTPQMKNDVYLDVQSVNFPWTQVGTSTSIKITLYNRSYTDKKVSLNRVESPFSVVPQTFVVPGKWQTPVMIVFTPKTATAEFSETLKMDVEGQTESLYAQLRGHSML